MESKTRKIIHRGHSILSVEVLSDDSHPVVIKKPSNRRSSRRITRSLENEYEITRSLDTVEGVRKAREQHSINNQPALILEYIDGQTLRNHAGRSTPNLRSKLEIAVDLARILSKVHQQGVIHLDLNSNNILIGNKKQTVHLIDLGSASRIHGSCHQSVQPDLGLESLPYISPEQTGRINRAVDERSDLYSLGVVLYELMTGQLPFETEKPIELIHSHIARTPRAPSEVSPEIPEMVSAIVVKLLSKDAEDRYQSAAGVHNDIEKCLERLAPGDVIADFALAEADFSSRLRFPQKLYGREKELGELVDDFDRACQETSVITFVSGYSGIGKTALVEEMQRPVSERCGYFAKGKFDQYQRTTPYSAITQAFAALVSQILTEPEESFNEWKDTIQSAVGDLGKVLTDVVPVLEELIGTQPSVPQLAGQESENRFNLVFINFITAVAAEEHPLVLFIDDLQWIDAASLKWLKVIRSDFNQPGLLVIGAYRDNEVDLTHPLMDILGDREAKGIRPRILKLDNLTQHRLEAFLSDTLSTQEGIEQLGSTIYERTEGNPFFMRRLLSSLNDEDRIRFDSELMSWTWDIAEIESAAIADNVADLLAQRILLLTEEAVNILKLAACIGNRFDISTLAMISGLTEQRAIRVLTATSCGQYVLESGDAHEFVHDQVQKAAYTLMDAGARTEKHLEIARLLLAGTAETELEERVFGIVSQFNLSADLLTDPTEKRRVAELNLLAGRRSKASSAFSAATVYLKHSLDLLGDNKWQDCYQLTLEIHDELIDSCYLNIQYGEVEALFDTVRIHARSDLDSCVAYKTVIMTRVAENEAIEAISLAEGYLERLHVSFDDAPTYDLTIEEIYELPAMEDKEKRAALEILMAIATPVIFSVPERLPSLFCTMLNITSRHGNCEVSCFALAWHGMLLCLQGRYREGGQYGELAVDLLNKFPSPGMSSKVMNMQNAWLCHWRSSVHDLIAPLKEYHHIGLKDGEFEWCLYCLGNYTLLLWGTGKALEVFAAEAEPCVRLCESKNQEITFLICSIFAQAGSNLTNETAQTTRLEGKWFSEESMLPKLKGNAHVLSFYRSVKITLSYLFGDSQEAYEHVDEALKTRSSLSPHYLYTKISFYGGLACIASLAGAEDEADRQERLERLELFEKELKLWSELAPMNYQHEYHLLQAERLRINDDHWQAVQYYEKAIKGAQENQFVHDEALANELFGRFWLEQGSEVFASVCLDKALDCYRQWGATAKVEDLGSRYPHLLSLKTGTPRLQGATVSSTTSLWVPGTEVDIDSLLKAAQALSGEIVLRRLLEVMVNIAIENAGAAKGVLLMPRQDAWFVEAERRVEDDEVSAEQSVALDENTELPISLILYVARTRETVVLADSTQTSLFARDAYLIGKRALSVLAMPLIGRGELTGILYLENNLATGVFSDERVRLLSLLSSQMAMALENAELYARLEERVAEKTADLEEMGQLLGQLRVSEERYELAVAGSSAGIWDWDVRADTVFFSDRLKDLLGYAPDEFSTSLDEFWSRLHPDDHETVRTVLEQHVQERVPFEIDYRLQAKSGKYRWFHARGQALWDKSGEATRMSGSITDITVRKQAEEALRESREKLLKAGQVAGMGFLDWNLKTNEIVWSREVYELYGIDPETPVTIEQTICLIHPEDRELVNANLEMAVQGIRDYDIDHRMVRPDGKAIWVHARADLRRDSEGKPTSMMGTVVDITERKLAEQEARKHQEALARVDRAMSLGHLTGSIAHELNQPLTGILSNAQAAEMMIESGQWDTEVLAEILAEIVADTKRGGQVVHNLRELYREQKGAFHPVDVNVLIDETIKLLNSEFVLHNIVLTTDCTASMPTVDGNRIQIQQVLVNLLMNSTEAMSGSERGDRQLHIVTASDSNEVEAWVEDRGPGIDADKIDHIFEPLATWKPGGTGMGLAISNSIILAHGGRMWAENRPDGGARVGFILPVLKESRQE